MQYVLHIIPIECLKEEHKLYADCIIESLKKEINVIREFLKIQVVIFLHQETKPNSD